MLFILILCFVYFIGALIYLFGVFDWIIDEEVTDAFDFLYCIEYVGYLIASTLILYGIIRAKGEKIRKGASLYIPITIFSAVIFVLYSIFEGDVQFIGLLLGIIVRILIVFILIWHYYKVADFCDRFGDTIPFDELI